MKLLPPPIGLRPGKEGDAAAVLDIFLRSRRQFLPYAPLVHSEEVVRRWIEGLLSPGGGVRVAMDQTGTILGMAALSWDDAGGAIDGLYVAPEAVGRGIGAALVQSAKLELGPPISLYTFQLNYPARWFYERHGFRPVLFRDGQQNEEKVPDVLYRWTGVAGTIFRQGGNGDAEGV